jgi:hypothetical protein
MEFLVMGCAISGFGFIAASYLFIVEKAKSISLQEDNALVRVKLSEYQDENYALRKSESDAVHRAETYRRLASDEDREWCEKIINKKKQDDDYMFNQQRMLSGMNLQQAGALSRRAGQASLRGFL